MSSTPDKMSATSPAFISATNTPTAVTTPTNTNTANTATTRNIAFTALEELVEVQRNIASAARCVAQSIAHSLFDALGVRSTLLLRGTGMNTGAAHVVGAVLGTISALTPPSNKFLRSVTEAAESLSGLDFTESALHWPGLPKTPYLHLTVRNGCSVDVRSATPRALALAALTAVADRAPNLEVGAFTTALDTLLSLCAPQNAAGSGGSPEENPLDEGTAVTLLLVIISQSGAPTTPAAIVAAALSMVSARSLTAAAALEISTSAPASVLAILFPHDILGRARELAARHTRVAPAPALCTGFAAATLLAKTELLSSSTTSSLSSSSSSSTIVDVDGNNDDTYASGDDSGGGVCDVLRPGRIVRGAVDALLRGAARYNAAEAAFDSIAARNILTGSATCFERRHQIDPKSLGFLESNATGCGNYQLGTISALDALSLSEALLAPVIPVAALVAILHEAIASSPRGALPVGEVGKILRAALSPRALADFKDRAGGLKRFIDTRTGEFSVATDHPFNPIVSRRSRLTSQSTTSVDFSSNDAAGTVASDVAASALGYFRTATVSSRSGGSPAVRSTKSQNNVQTTPNLSLAPVSWLESGQAAQDLATIWHAPWYSSFG